MVFCHRDPDLVDDTAVGFEKVGLAESPREEKMSSSLGFNGGGAFFGETVVAVPPKV